MQGKNVNNIANEETDTAILQDCARHAALILNEMFKMRKQCLMFLKDRYITSTFYTI